MGRIPLKIIAEFKPPAGIPQNRICYGTLNQIHGKLKHVQDRDVGGSMTILINLMVSGEIRIVNKSKKTATGSDCILLLLIFAGLSCSNTDEGKKMNRLADEQSPYLLQHAENPVNWYPWDEDAFETARELNRPIFLSIGYSTCHWCHVMEHESFEDEEVARLLNDNFIAIKVDREEMPEIDHLYMSVCQAMTGSGGWPLTIVMTPDKQPFFAGTYFPKNGRYGRTGMLQLLPALADAWKNRPEDVSKTVGQIKNYLENSIPNTLGAELDESIHERTFNTLRDRFDEQEGGFGQAPKFPSPHNLIYLLRYYHFSKDSSALAMVEKTLKAIRRGGIFDQLGFGFHRYSTDRNWLLPHFEKMLYDQALLALAYLEAYQLTENDEYGRSAEEIFTYVQRDMTAPEGGFYSAEDADSEGQEGKFYIWKKSEIIEILGDQDGEKFCNVFQVKDEGNFHPEAGNSAEAGNILHLSSEKSSVNDEFIESSRKKLFAVREKRIHPFKDDKILTDWNGLMLAALARGAIVLDNTEYGKAAEKAIAFISKKMTGKNGRLYKRYRNGLAGLDAHLDDYAFLIWGLLEFYEYSFNPEYLSQALKLARIMKTEFLDGTSGGFFLGSSQAEKLPVRSKIGYDGAIPSGNSVAAMVLQKLGRITGETEWLLLADNTIRVFANAIDRYPAGFAHLLTAHLFEADNPKEIVIVLDKNSQHLPEIVNEIRAIYTPAKVLLLKQPDSGKTLAQIAPWTTTQSAMDNRPTVYVCRNYSCNQPVTDLASVMELIDD